MSDKEQTGVTLGCMFLYNRTLFFLDVIQFSFYSPSFDLSCIEGFEEYQIRSFRVDPFISPNSPQTENVVEFDDM